LSKPRLQVLCIGIIGRATLKVFNVLVTCLLYNKKNSYLDLEARQKRI
jgi:hypothetical protein